MEMVSNNLSTWLANKLNEHSWSARELGRKIDLSHTTINRYIEGSSIPSPRTCQKLAIVLDADPQEIMRLAGHLPPQPPPALHEDQLLHLYRQLDEGGQQELLAIARTLRDTRVTYHANQNHPD